MNKWVCFFITLILAFCSGFCIKPAFAAEIPDIHSLFYIRQSVSYYDFLLLVFIVFLWIALLAAVMSVFSLILSVLRVGEVEAFLVKKLYHVKQNDAFCKGMNLLGAVSSNDVVVAGRTVPRQGISFIRCGGTGQSSGVVYSILDGFVSGRKKPVLYWGKNQQGILSDTISTVKPDREALRRMAAVLTRGLLIAPSLEPDPDKMAVMLKKSCLNSGAGALILEDPGNGFLRNYLSVDKRGEKLSRLSEAFHLPVLIVTDDEQLNENTIS